MSFWNNRFGSDYDSGGTGPGGAEGGTDGYYDSVKKNRNNTLLIFVIIIVAYAAYSFLAPSSSCGGVTETGRVKLDSSMCNLLNAWYEQDTDYTDGNVTNAMITFYETTGVEPFVLIVNDGRAYTSDELNTLAENYYENSLFSENESLYDEGHFVVAFLPQGDSYEVGYFVGADAAGYIPEGAEKAVLDEDALNTFDSLLAENYSKYDGYEILEKTFENAGSDIMGRSKSMIFIIIIIVVICILYFMFNMFKKRKTEIFGAGGGAQGDSTQDDAVSGAQGGGTESGAQGGGSEGGAQGGGTEGGAQGAAQGDSTEGGAQDGAKGGSTEGGAQDGVQGDSTQDDAVSGEDSGEDSGESDSSGESSGDSKPGSGAEAGTQDDAVSGAQGGGSV